MSRQYKTSKKHRTNYIYYTAEGTKIVITPCENGVTEADIQLLHSLDDAEVDEQRRYNYRVTTHLDGYYDGEDVEVGDRNGYLADNSMSPETTLMAEENEAAYQEFLKQLGEALKILQPQQQDLFKKVYVQRRTNTDIALEEGVTEAAIRKRLKKMHDKLRKFFP